MTHQYFFINTLHFNSFPHNSLFSLYIIYNSLYFISSQFSKLKFSQVKRYLLTLQVLKISTNSTSGHYS